MESELSPDKENNIPPVPLQTYQWEDLRRARKAGGYPWTHILKAPLEGEITAEDIIRETTPRRSMSREFSKSRTHSPADMDGQRILNLDSSPGSSRKHNEEGIDEGIHIPNFSKEISLESEDDVTNNKEEMSENQNTSNLIAPVEISKNVSPKSILKRRAPEQQYIGLTETRENTKCCHPLVNKIKHLADKTLHKLEKLETEKSPTSKRRKHEDIQEIRQLRNSPGAVRRQKFSAIKLGSSDEMSKNMSVDTPPPRKKKEHIYEDIEESKSHGQNLNGSESKITNQESDSVQEKKSNASQDPSLFSEDNVSLKADEYIMEKLHNTDNTKQTEMPLNQENNQDEVLLVTESRTNNDSPNITITEISEDDATNNMELSTTIPIETSPSPSPRDHARKENAVEFFEREWSKPSRWTSEGGTPIEKPLRPTREGSVQLYTPEVRCACQFFQCDSLLPERVNLVGTRPTSRASNIISNVSDHEYEVIEKPPPHIIYTAASVDDPPTSTITKADDEFSSTTSLERKCLQHHSDDEDQFDDKENLDDTKDENILNAEALQKDIEDRFFVNTPSTVSRTECEVSTSQVDSSALENLPLKRDSRNKNGDNVDSKIQQRIKEGTGKLKTQAGKLKTKLQNLKTKPFTLPDRPKFKMPEKPKITLPDRPKFTFPDRRKFSLPDRPKFKKINISEKLSFGDRKKFTLPERPKFNIPDLPKFKMPERPKLNFSSLGRKKHIIDNNVSESTSDLQNMATVEFEAKTYPRLFNKKKKSQISKTSSSPTLNREETPPPTFTFTRVKKPTGQTSGYIPDSPEQPREYGTIDNESELESRKQFVTTYDFDKVNAEYHDDINNQSDLQNATSTTSITEISPSTREYTHINELNNDEFFVRPRGISRENIQVREYLSDEIRQAFNIPKNVLAVMGSNSKIVDDNMYVNEPEADLELMINDNDQIKYSSEDINEGDDGYYTFPPVRPSRAKRKKKEVESIQYIDDSVNVSMQFSDIDLGLSEEQFDKYESIENGEKQLNDMDIRPPTDLRSIHEYANDDVIEYPEAIQSQTLPMPPKRKKKFPKDLRHSSLHDFNNFTPSGSWQPSEKESEDIIVYRVEHEYIVPPSDKAQTPLPPVRSRSGKSSRTTSLCDDDRTSHGAESLILDTHMLPTDIVDDREVRHESPGYATVDKGSYVSAKKTRRSTSKTPPARRRKSNSSERKYYTVSGTKSKLPNRPPRKKSSASLLTLDSFTKGSLNGDFTQYVEIDEQQIEEVHRNLKSGDILSKMKDRPLPPPPRPPRETKRKKRETDDIKTVTNLQNTAKKFSSDYRDSAPVSHDVIEIEVSTQTDPLPDDVEFELGIDDNDISMSSSLRDIIDEESIVGKNKPSSPYASRSASRSEKAFKLSDPKISDLSKSNIERASPTVILVEKRVSSPTRINERAVMLTEASLTVQPIDIDESQIPDVPPLPRPRAEQGTPTFKAPVQTGQECALQNAPEVSRDIQLDNLVTRRLQVSDLDVGRLNVSELQANKILVSDIEGMTLNVTELDSKSGHISVNGIEFSQSVIDEIVKKFAEISTSIAPPPPPPQIEHNTELMRPVSREEETQTETSPTEAYIEKETIEKEEATPPPPPPLPFIAQTATATVESTSLPPQRPPPPDLAPLLFSYLQDIANLPTSVHNLRPFRERPISDFFEAQHQAPPLPTRRTKRKPALPHSESSSDEDKPRPSPRRMPPPVRTHEPTITEAGAQFLRVCQNSITRTIRNIFNTFLSYINRTEDKKDVQMAMVIFLVLIAGLIMFGLSDSRTVHHHHWEFFNPPDTNK